MKKAPTAPAKEYIKSDHFIHDYLVGLLIPLVEKLRKVANEGGDVSSVLVFWPERKIDNSDFNTVIMDVPDPAQMKELAQGGAAKTKPIAIGFILTDPDGIRIGLETRAGTELWHIQKQKRGDIYFFKEPERTSNTECLGVLWNQG
jgi:hypothetical protein